MSASERYFPLATLRQEGTATAFDVGAGPEPAWLPTLPPLYPPDRDVEGMHWLRSSDGDWEIAAWLMYGEPEWHFIGDEVPRSPEEIGMQGYSWRGVAYRPKLGRYLTHASLSR